MKHRPNIMRRVDARLLELEQQIESRLEEIEKICNRRLIELENRYRSTGKIRKEYGRN